MKLCKCGCNREIKDNRTYVYGHNRKGCGTNNLGIGWTHKLETILKLKERIHTEEHNRKVSEALIGKKLSKEHINKLSISHQGKGRPHTTEAKEKIRQARLKQIMPSISSCEYKLYNELKKSGLNPISQVTIGITQVDLAFPDKNIAIFVDGCYWHNCQKHFPNPNNQTKKFIGRDKYINEFLRRAGWNVLRFWEHDISPDHLREKNNNIDTIIQTVQEEYYGS